MLNIVVNTVRPENAAIEKSSELYTYTSYSMWLRDITKYFVFLQTTWLISNLLKYE